MSKVEGKLIVISAPSGTGKGTVIEQLLELRPNLVMSVSATTRQPRKGEDDGLSYYFVTRGQFQEMIERGEFLEYAEYVGEFYGTPKIPVFEYRANGIDVLLEIEVQGARQVMAMAPDAVTIFLAPPDFIELEHRLRGRGTDSEEDLTARLDIAQTELERKNDYQYIVVNNNAARAAIEILEIIDS